MLSLQQLQQIAPYSAGKAAVFIDPLNAAMTEFSINTARRISAFLAQVLHESGEFRYTRELATGDAYEPPSQLAVNLGNTQPGDGPRYKGRGLLQITGRANYEACGKALNLTLILNPTLLEVPSGACRSAAWFWKSKGLNELADQNAFGSITKRINGGFAHIDERLAYWLLALQATGAL